MPGDHRPLNLPGSVRGCFAAAECRRASDPTAKTAPQRLCSADNSGAKSAAIDSSAISDIEAPASPPQRLLDDGFGDACSLRWWQRPRKLGQCHAHDVQTQVDGLQREGGHSRRSHWLWKRIGAIVAATKAAVAPHW